MTDFTQVKSIANILQDRSVPSFVVDEYPIFVDFLNAYLEFMEQQKYPHDIAINLRDYKDIDRTLDEFVEHFRKEFLVDIPVNILADKRLLVKQIKQFYLNKGNEQSFRFLFRILFNENIEFYYPKTDILRASDGKWYEQTSIKVILPDSVDLNLLNSKQITGRISKTSATIESVIKYTDRGETTIELSLSNIRGTFQAGELIDITYFDSNGVKQTITASTIEMYAGITVTHGGSGYSIGQEIIVRDVNNNEIAKAVVQKVTNGPITGFTVIDGGQGYRGTQQQIDRFYGLPMNFVWMNNISIHDAPMSPVNVGDFDYYNTPLNQLIDIVNIADTGDSVSVLDFAGAAGEGGFGTISLVDSSGSILAIALNKGGNNYQAPYAVENSLTGTGANIHVIGGGGSINKVVLERFPPVLSGDLVSGEYTVYPDFTGAGDANATGTITTSIIAAYPGRYLNEDGFLSAGKKLQDNNYYQDFSYVIKVGIDITKWKDIVKKIIHPAGFALFGEVDIVSSAGSIAKLSTTKITRIIDSTISTPATFGTTDFGLYYDLGGIYVPINTDNNYELLEAGGAKIILENGTGSVALEQ